MPLKLKLSPSAWNPILQSMLKLSSILEEGTVQ